MGIRKKLKEKQIKKEDLKVEMSFTPPKKTGAYVPSTPKGKGIGEANYMKYNLNVRKQRQIKDLPENDPLMQTEILISDPPTAQEMVRPTHSYYNFNMSKLSEENQMLAAAGAAAAQYAIAENKKKNPHLYTRNNSNKYKTPSRQIRPRNQRKSRKTRKNRK